MAKKNPFKKMQQDIHALKLANADDLSGDYKFTNNQMGAIFGNLATTGKSLGRTLTATQGRELAAMQRLASRGSKQAARGLGAARGQVRSQFGSAVGAGGADIFGVAKATAAASGTQSKAALGAGKMLAAGGQIALGAARAGASEAASGAQYALAVAMKSRGQQDAASIAEHQLALDQMKLQSTLQRQEFMWQQKQAVKAATKAKNELFATSLSQSTPILANQAGAIETWVAEWQANPDNEGKDISDIPFTDYWKAKGLDPADPAYNMVYPAMSRAWGYMQEGMDPSEAIQQAMDHLYGTEVGYESADVGSVISTGVEAHRTDRTADLMRRDLTNDLTPAEKKELQAIYDRAWKEGVVLPGVGIKGPRPDTSGDATSSMFPDWVQFSTGIANWAL